MLVAEHVGILQGLQIADTIGCAQRPGGFVLQTTGSAPVLRAVLDAEMGLVDLRNAAAGDGAAETRGVGHQMRLAIGRPLFVHRFGRDLASFLELHIAVIARGQGSDFVDHVHQHLGAVLRQALAGYCVVGEHLLRRLRRLQEGRKILDARDTLGAANRHGLEILRAHHRTNAGTSGSTVQVIDDAGEEHLIFARRPDRRHLDLRILMTRLDRLFGLPAGLAPEVGSAAQLGFVVLQIEIDRFRRFAFEDDHVPAGKLHLGAEIAARVGAGNGVGQGALGDDGIAAAGRGHRAGQRTGRHDHLVVRRQRIDLGVDFLDQIL